MRYLLYAAMFAAYIGFMMLFFEYVFDFRALLWSMQ